MPVPNGAPCQVLPCVHPPGVPGLPSLAPPHSPHARPGPASLPSPAPAPPKPPGADGEGPLAAAREFKQMVKVLHEAGIEVILDVVYNHTVEGGCTVIFFIFYFV